MVLSDFLIVIVIVINSAFSVERDRPLLLAEFIRGLEVRLDD